MSRRLILLAIGLAAAALAVTGFALVANWHPERGGAPVVGSGPGISNVDGSGDGRGATGSFEDPRPPDHIAGKAVWMKRHGSQVSASCSICHPAKRCRDCHGTQMPHVAGWPQAHGKVVLAAGRQVCAQCHQDDKGSDPKTGCRACHGIAMPHPARWVASGHRVAARAGNAVCATCHTRKTCENCHAADQVSSCRTCHATKVTAIARRGGHATSQCLTCHEKKKDVIGPGPGHRTIPVCMSCHTTSRLSPPIKLQSQRDWTTTNGLGFTAWAKRASHSTQDLLRCGTCHTVHDAAVISFPLGVSRTAKSCGLSCHSWLKGNVVSRGFLNSSGDPEATTYRGPISPEQLLGGGTTKHTSVVYAATGCAGRCHQGPHGTVTPCIKCHEFSWGTPGALHDTHVPLISGEQSQADPGNADGQTVCRYCHKPGDSGVKEGNTLWRRACYSCHLSGHNPIVPYWKLPGA